MVAAKWVDFERLNDAHEPALQGRSRTELFARWQCPFCPKVVRALASGAPDNKSHACRQHLWGGEPCPNRPPDDLRGKPKEKAPVPAPVPAPAPAESTPVVTGAAVGSSNDQSVLAALREQDKTRADEAERLYAESQKQTGLLEQMLAEMTRKHDTQEQRGNSWKRKTRDYHADSNVSSPRSSENEEEHKSRCTRVHDSNVTEGRQQELGRVDQSLGIEAPEEPEDIDAWSKRTKERAAEASRDASQVPGLKGQLRDVHVGLRIDPDAPPAERNDTIKSLQSEKSRLDQYNDNAKKHFESLNSELRIRHNATPDQQIEAIKGFRKAAAVAKTTGKRAKTVASSEGLMSDETIEYLKKELKADPSLARSFKTHRNKVLERDPDNPIAKEYGAELSRVIPDSGCGKDDLTWNKSGTRHA